MLTLSSCGGGTVGTSSGSTITLSGSIRNSDGGPVSFARLSVPDSMDATITDENGEFSLDAAVSLENVILIVELESFSAEVALGSFDKETDSIVVALEVSFDSNDIRILSAEVSQIPPVTDDEDATEAQPVADPVDDASDVPRVTVFRGILLQPDGLPLENARISIFARREFDFTNSTGEFRLQVDRISGSATIQVRTDTLETSVRISNIPDENVEIRLTLQLEGGADGAFVDPENPDPEPLTLSATVESVVTLQ